MTTIHGHARHDNVSRTYHTWIGMKTRCSNRNHVAYKNYGGRGIKVCGRWLKFKNFLEDMGERPEGLTIDRIDNDGNYEPGNCEWSTTKEQNRNGRRTKLNSLKAQVIKKLLKESSLMVKEIAEIFYVTTAAIQDIKREKTWLKIN